MERKLLRLAFSALMALLLAISHAHAQLPTLLSLPDTPCDSTSCGALYFANDGDERSVIVSIFMRDSVSFAITSAITLPDTILSHQSRSMTICFTPTRRGVITDSLHVIIQTATGLDTAKVRVTGLSIGPDIAVSPSVLNFPKVNPGGSSTLKMALVNDGERPFVLDATTLTIPPPFRLITPLPATIDPGDTLFIEIAFEPQQRGVYSEQTDLIGGCTRKIQLGLNGVTDLIGTGAVLRLSKVAFNPANDEQTPCDVSLCDTMYFSNVGNAMLIVDSIRWTDGSLGYTFDPPLVTPFYITPNSQRAVRVCLDSRHRGYLRDTLVVRSNTRTSIAFGMVIDVSKSMTETMACVPVTTRMAQAIVQGQNFISRTLLYLPSVGIQDQLVVQSYTNNRSSRFPFPIISEINYPFPLAYIDDVTRETAKAAVGTLVPSGGTPTGEAMMAMMDVLDQSPLRNRVIVLLTDGDANDAGTITVADMVAKARARGIRIFTIGLGLNTPSASSYLNGLARGTNGVDFNASSCDSLQTAFEAITDSVSRGTIQREPFAMKVISPLLITSKSLDFDSLYIGGRVCRQITLTNVGEGEAIVDSSIFRDLVGDPTAEFSLDTGIVFPLRIPESGQIALSICFEPAKIRKRDGRLRFTYNSCGSEALDMDLTGAAYAAADLRITDQRTGLPGDIVRMPIYADTSLATYSVDTITYQVRWDKSMLDLRGIYPGSSAAGSSVVVTTPVAYGDHYATVGITTTGQGLGGGGELAEMEFQVLRGDSLRSLVEVTDGKFQDDNPRTHLINAGIIAFDSTCFLGAKPINAGAAAKVIVGDAMPMPSAIGRVSLPVTADAETAISVEVYAADGSLVMPASERLIGQGAEPITLDVGGLASGSYYALVRTASGETSVRKFIIER